MSPLRTATLICLLLGTCGRSEAVKLAFNPTLLEVSTNRSPTTSTQVTNQDSEPMDFTAEVLKWTQKDGQDVLEPSRDVVVSPQKFVVLPGRSQTVRVAVRLRGGDLDSAYRLVLTAVPKAPKPGPANAAEQITNTVLTNYAFRIPLFVTNSRTHSNLSFTLNRQSAVTTLGIINSGNGVAILRNIALSSAAGKKVLGNTYVLPQSTKEITVEGGVGGTQKVSVSYEEGGASRSKEIGPASP